jgi:hypothetical protein
MEPKTTGRAKKTRRSPKTHGTKRKQDERNKERILNHLLINIAITNPFEAKVYITFPFYAMTMNFTCNNTLLQLF